MTKPVFSPLFGASASDGWAQCGPGYFTLTNGVATSHGGMGLWWHTNRTFTNFVIRGEWRMEERESDSGVFIRFPHPGPGSVGGGQPGARDGNW